MDTLATRLIPESALPEVGRRLNEMAAAFEKRNIPVPHIEEGERKEQPICAIPHVHRDACPTETWVEVSVVGEPPRFEGWTLLAAIDNVEGAVLLRGVPNLSVPDKYRDADPTNCDHCGSSRQRTSTYLVRHEDGRILQVGSNCLKDFLGWSVDGVLDVFDSVAGVLDDFDNEGGGGWLEDNREFPFDHIVRAAATIVSVDGIYVKRNNEADAEPTSSRVQTLLFPPKGSPGWYRDFVDKYSGQDERANLIVEKTLEGVARVAEKRDPSDWEYNIITLARANRVPSRHINTAISAVTIGMRAIEQEVEARAVDTEPSEYVGAVGERITIKVSVLDSRFVDSDWGGSYLVTMRQVGTPNILKWWASNPEVEADKEYDLTGTVKRHEEWKGRHHTILTRCKTRA